jgi:carbon storage regulator
MLVISRKKNESIIINDDITVVVVEIRGDKVRLGVEAPKEIPMHKNEVYDAIRRQSNATADAHQESIRRQIEELRQQIRDLEAQLTG